MTAALAAAIGDPSGANPKDTIARNFSLDEVEIVSYVKENSSMRLQPTSVSLISKKQMDDNHVTSLKGVSGLVPNFFMPDYGSRLTSAVYIRGVGSRMNTPAVGMYVDNVPYVDKSAFDFNFHDIERIDVLRGPQATLYGRNAMGGIIRVYTKNPFLHTGTDFKAGFATRDNHHTVSLTHYAKVSDVFAFSAGGYYEGSNGFFSNVTTGNKADAMKSGGGRLRGILKTSDRLSFDLSLNYDYSDEGAYPYYYMGNLAAPTDEAASIGTICNNRESRYRRGLFNAGLNIEYTAPAFTMNAITGYQNLNDRMYLDQDFISRDIYTLEQKQRINTLTEEVTFKSNGDRFWEWLCGVSGMYQTLHTDGPVTFFGDGLRWLEGNINSHMPDVSAIPTLWNMGFTSMAVNFRGDELRMGGAFETPTCNIAAFHQSTFNITSRLSATLGLRLDYEYMKMDYNAPALVDYGFLLANHRAAVMQVDLQDLSANLNQYTGKVTNDYLRLLPKFALKYALNNRSNVYFSVAQGQRSGGYNVQMFSDILQGAMQNAMMKGIQEGVAGYMQKFVGMGMPSAVINSVVGVMKENMPIGEDPTVDQVVYKPELSWNYEVGTHLNIADNVLQIDAAVFIIDTKDQQIARFTPSGLGRMMVNAGKSRSYGGEVSALWHPLSQLAITANYGFTQAKFRDYDAGNGMDYTGNYVPYVPCHTVNLDAAYTFTLSKDNTLRTLTLGADYRGAGKMYWNEGNTASQDYYSLLGARLTLGTSFGDIQLWARNITGTTYNSFMFESANRAFEQHGKPFQMGVEVRVKL